MIREEEVYLVGKINKPHGTKGELQFTITDDINICLIELTKSTFLWSFASINFAYLIPSEWEL